MTCCGLIWIRKKRKTGSNACFPGFKDATERILYTSEDGRSRIQLRADERTVWLTQLEMADLFATTKQNISLHLQNIFEDNELQESSVVKESLTTAADGKNYETKLCNLQPATCNLQPATYDLAIDSDSVNTVI